jgi:N-acetylmuramoyl-L-alanine amidase
MNRFGIVAVVAALGAFVAAADAQEAGTPQISTRPPIYEPDSGAAPQSAPAKTGTVSNPSGLPPVVISARIGEHLDRTRFVVELSDPLKFTVFTLSNPDRVVIDMPEVLWRLTSPDHPQGTGAVRSYRYGLFRPGDSRFVIDLNTPVSAGQPMILPPEGGNGYRIVLDLFPTTQAKFEQTAGWPSELRAKEAAAEKLAALPALPQPSPSAGYTANVVPVPPPQISTRKIVVLDPGHGGIDSGTVGTDGTLEKNVVLDEGLRLRKVLEARGYTVHMTRDTDVFIPLPERVNISRGYGADLFISLHADSNPDTSVNGASIYTLSASGSDKEAAALARKENQSDIIAGVDLSGENSPVASILIALAQRDTMNRSSRFAENAVGELSQATDILPREPHRSAAFAVLKAPDVPAVLIELGYLSNNGDRSQMVTDHWRDGVAGAIGNAVDRYFASGAAVTPVAAAQSPE